MYHLLWFILIGLVVGAVARMFAPGRGPAGCWTTVALGIAGSLLATYLGQILGLYRHGQRAGFIMSVLGALVLLTVHRIVKGGGGPASPSSSPQR